MEDFVDFVDNKIDTYPYTALIINRRYRTREDFSQYSHFWNVLKNTFDSITDLELVERFDSRVFYLLSIIDKIEIPTFKISKEYCGNRRTEIGEIFTFFEEFFFLEHGEKMFFERQGSKYQ